MRSRNIKPAFFLNEGLSTISPHARLLFIGLWCYADREGFFEWRPLRIKAAIFPYENIDIVKLLDELKCIGNVLYMHCTSTDMHYGCIPHFTKHQYPHSHETKSKVPNSIKEQCLGMYSTCTGNVRLNPDILNPSSLNPDSPLHPPTGGNVAKTKKEKEPETYSEDFEKFWTLYPFRSGKPLGKQPSWIKFKQIPAADVPAFLAAVKNYADSKPELGVKDAERWILSGKGNGKHEPWREWVNAPADRKPKSEFTEDHHARARAAYEKKFGGLSVVGK